MNNFNIFSPQKNHKSPPFTKVEHPDNSFYIGRGEGGFSSTLLLLIQFFPKPNPDHYWVSCREFSCLALDRSPDTVRQDLFNIMVYLKSHHFTSSTLIFLFAQSHRQLIDKNIHHWKSLSHRK